MDGRKLSHEAREEIRIRAVQRVEAGESPEDVISTLVFHRSCIYDWLARYREGGIDALRYKKIPGRKPRLSGSQLKQLFDWITLKSPQQMQFDFALWTRDMIRQVIYRELGARLSVVSVGRLLRKLGLSPQKPLRRAYQQDPEAVEHWKKVEYPKIRAAAKREGASIFFADEANVRSDYHSGTTWAPVGQTPIVPKTGARFSMNLISAISPRGAMRFMTIDGKMTAPKFIEFLRRLLVGATHPIYLIVDRHPVHRSGRVRQFVESTDGKLKLFFLPSYSPELNPDEQVWNNLKNHKVGRMTPMGPDQLKKAVLRCLRSLQRMPVKVSRFFRHPETLYTVA